MPGLDADTSSYPKLPTNSGNFLDTAGKLQGLQQGQQAIQSNAIQIDQQKYNLVKQKWEGISKQMPGLIADPNLTEAKIIQLYQNNVNQGLMTEDMAANAISQIPSTQGMPAPQAANILRRDLAQRVQQGQTMMEALEMHLPKPELPEIANQQVPATVSRLPPSIGGGIRQIQPGIPIQLPPGTDTTAPGGTTDAQGNPIARGTPGKIGPVAPGTPSGLPTAPGALPSGPAPVPPGMTMGGGKVTGINVGPDQPNMGTGGVPTAGAPKPVPTQSFTPTGLPPGASAAMTASGEQLAQARLKSASFQRDIFPLVQAIPALEKLGTKGTGPGTETINNLKSFAISNIPGVKESDFDGVKDYDKAKKYLTDFVNQTGNSGTNDKLAAAFAGNPSTHISNAAAVDVAKSALALRRMEQAKQLTFEQSGEPEGNFSKWSAEFTNALDPRAFGVDLMDKSTLQKMYKQIDKNPTEAKRFDKSLDIAHKLGFVTPPSAEQ